MPNRLANETSPYLRQHANNPVDWHPWGQEALALAGSSNRPILLSVGYSACHWCHVMAHECFENEDTAALMNRHFVNIKVDREERPDIDQIYQTAHQLMARRPGGSPLTMFLTPAGEPLFGGTYFPKRARHQLPGFDKLLPRLAEVWNSQREQVMAHADALAHALAATLPTAQQAASRLDVIATQAASARHALDFICRALWRDSRLLATHKDGRSHLNAYLDDHAFLLAALLEFMQGEPLRAADLQFACALADLLLEQFEDKQDGGFFFTSHDHETLVLRPKSGLDGATASGNGVAAVQLQRLGHLIGEPRYLIAAQRTLELFAAGIERSPSAYPTLIDAMAEYLRPPAVLLLSGPTDTIRAWRCQLDGRYRPDLLVTQLPLDGSDLPALLAKPLGADAQAWLCRGARCLAPVGDIGSLLSLLDSDQADAPS